MKKLILAVLLASLILPCCAQTVTRDLQDSVVGRENVAITPDMMPKDVAYTYERISDENVAKIPFTSALYALQKDAMYHDGLAQTTHYFRIFTFYENLKDNYAAKYFLLYMLDTVSLKTIGVKENLQKKDIFLRVLANNLHEESSFGSCVSLNDHSIGIFKKLLTGPYICDVFKNYDIKLCGKYNPENYLVDFNQIREGEDAYQTCMSGHKLVK